VNEEMTVSATEPWGDRPGPEVPILLRVAAPLEFLADAGHPQRTAVEEALAQGLTGLIATLGVPGAPAVRVEALGGAGASARRVLEVRVHGRLCPLPDQSLQAIACYVDGVPLRPRAGRLALLPAAVREAPDGPGGAPLAATPCHACHFPAFRRRCRLGPSGAVGFSSG